MTDDAKLASALYGDMPSSNEAAKPTTGILAETKVPSKAEQLFPSMHEKEPTELYPKMEKENRANRADQERQAQDRAAEEQREHTEAHEAALEGLSETQATFVQNLDLSASDFAYVDRQLDGIEDGSLTAEQMFHRLEGLANKHGVTFEQFEAWLSGGGDDSDPFSPEAIAEQVKQMPVEELDAFAALGNLYDEALSSGDEAKMVELAGVVSRYAQALQVTPDRAMDILFGPEE